MRVELALIVGILFFCCWCAYIIVKMNSSVSTSHPNTNNNNNHHLLQPLASDATFTRLNNGSDVSSYLYSHSQKRPSSNQAPMLSMMGRNQEMQLRQQSSLPQASYVRQESIRQPTTTATGSSRYYAQPSTTNIHHQITTLQHPKPPYSALTNTWTAQQPAAQSNVNRYSHQSTPSSNNHWRNQYYQNNMAQNNWRPQVAAQSYFGRPSNSYAPPRTYGTPQAPATTNNNLFQSNPWRPATTSPNLYAKQGQRSSIDYSGDVNSSNDQQATNGSSADADPDPDPDPDPDSDATKTQEGNQGEEEQSAPSNDQGAPTDETDQQQQPELNTEIEERDGQRSYSEDETDANERDKDGNVLVRHHKHLINGKPIKKDSIKRAAREKEAEERSKNADFEKIAREIEEENQNAPDDEDVPNSVQQETGESRERRKVMEPSGAGLVDLDTPLIGPNETMDRADFGSELNARGDRTVNRNLSAKVSPSNHVKGNRRRNVSKRVLPISENKIGEVIPSPKKGRELHEHKLKESLTAQQWDDDASSPVNDKNHGIYETAKKLPTDDREQLESSSSTDGSDKATETPSDELNKNEQDVNAKEEMEAEGETGPQQVEAEFKDLDLIADPEKFMHSDRRKKRQVVNIEPNLIGNQTNVTQIAIDYDDPPLHNNSLVLPDQVEFDDADSTSLSNATNLIFTDTNTNHSHDSKDEEIVSGQENINHEMAASPPMIDGNNSYEQQSNQAVAIDVLPPPVNMNNQIDPPPSPHEGTDTYSAFYENQQEPSVYADNSLVKPQDQAPSSNTFYPNGHSSGPYDVPAPQYYNQDNQYNGPSQEVEPQQHYSDQHHNEMDPSRLAQLQPISAPPTQISMPPPSRDSVEYQNQPVDHQIDQMVEINSPQMPDKPSNAIDYNPLASGSKSKSKKVKKKKFKKSKLSESKRKAALAQALKKKSKSKKGGGNKKKSEAKKKSSVISKEFKGTKRGKKEAKGGGQHGGNKGNLYYKDQGYKKRGFKKAYQKLETGDHKTYFDEFRDKDHNKKWKKFKDKHNYSQNKHWKGKDHKKYHNYDSKELKDKKYGVSKHKASSKYKKASKHASDKAYEKKKKMSKNKKKAKEMKKKSKDKYDKSF